MMGRDPAVREYMRSFRRSLEGLERVEKNNIIGEVEGHINERIDITLAKKKDHTLKERDIQRILSEFGSPEDLAMSYRMQISEEKGTGGRAKGRKKFIGIIIAVALILIITSLSLYYLIEGGEAGDNTILPGEGFDDIKIGDDMDSIIDDYGAPEERSDTGNTIWISYRSENGLDFLISNRTGKIMEIRFNEGYDGSLGNGLKIGDDLDLLFEKEGSPLLVVDATRENVHNNSEGGDRVLYRQMNNDGMVEAYKYVDERRGILFWADMNRIISQIVVFEPFD
jgi:hypothetical protein